MAQSFIARLVEIERKVAEQERRNRNRRRTGVVSEVDHAKGLARVKLSDQPRPYLTGWVPWREVAAGGTSTHIPPVVGEQVDVVSESGDLTDAVIDFSTHSNKNPRPHDGPEAVIVHGNVRIEIADDKVTVTSADVLIKANVKIEGDLDVSGGTFKHDGRNVGVDHQHKNTMPGSGLSGPPKE